MKCLFRVKSDQVVVGGFMIWINSPIHPKARQLIKPSFIQKTLSSPSKAKYSTCSPELAQLHSNKSYRIPQ